MSEKNSELSLDGKMDDWGPYEKNEGKWLIFSIGNPEEGHGYALPRIADDLHAQRVAHLISVKTGSRYVAHVPWTTDFTDAGRLWSPKYIPVKELVERLKGFLRYHINIYKEMGFPASKIFIYTGHGGNNPLFEYEEEIKNDLKLEKVIIPSLERLAQDNTDKILGAIEGLTKELALKGGNPKKIKRELYKIMTSAGHAGHMEHSMLYAIGAMDEEKLKIMNKELEKDFDNALKKWPPLGGLGGYLIQGKYPEHLGTKENDTHNLWKCLKALRTLDGGKVKPIKELGELVINLIVDYFSEILLNE